MIDPTTGVLSGTPPNQGDGSSTLLPYTEVFFVNAANTLGTDSQLFELFMDQAPAITSSASTTFTPGQLGSFTVIATGNPTPTFSISGNPPWLSINPTTGVLSGTPPGVGPYSVSFTITASNGITPDFVQPFTLNVQHVNQPPVNTVPGTQFTLENEPVVITGISTADPYAGSSPISMTLSVLDGTVSVNPSVTGGVPLIDISGNGTGLLVLNGSTTEINATLTAGLTYQPAPDFLSTDTLTVYTYDNTQVGVGGPQKRHQHGEHPD